MKWPDGILWFFEIDPEGTERWFKIDPMAKPTLIFQETFWYDAK